MHGIGANSAETNANDSAHWVLSAINACDSLSGGGKPEGDRERVELLEKLDPEYWGVGAMIFGTPSDDPRWWLGGGETSTMTTSPSGCGCGCGCGCSCSCSCGCGCGCVCGGYGAGCGCGKAGAGSRPYRAGFGDGVREPRRLRRSGTSSDTSELARLWRQLLICANIT